MVGKKEEKKDVIAVDGSEEKSEMKEKGGEVEKESEGEKEVKEEGEKGDTEKKEEEKVVKEVNEGVVEEIEEEEKEAKEKDNEEKNNESEENPKAEEIVDVKEEKSNDDEKEVNESNENETKEEEATKTSEEAGNEKQEETREEDKNTTANEENHHETNDNNEENPIPSLAPNNHNTEETTNLELSNTTLPYSRRPRRTSPRTPYNDIYLNTRNRYRQAVEGEGRFVQHHKIKYYEGSHLDTTPRNRSALPVTDTFDFTVISQTTFFLSSPVTPSKERLFFFPYLLQRWKGFSPLASLTRSPLSIAIMTNVTDTEEIETFIQSSNFPDRLRLALYITGLPGKTDCVYRRTSRGLRCVRATIYPLNRLRNIAIQNSLTSHFVVFDMDMWPASFFFRSLSLLEHTYKTLRSLSPSYLANPFAVTIIPAFSLPPALLESAKCRSFRGCVTAIATRLPETKQQLVHCLRKRGCSIFRPKSLTHVGVAARCHVGLSPEQLGDASGDDGGDVHEVLPTAVHGAVRDGATHRAAPAVRRAIYQLWV